MGSRRRFARRHKRCSPSDKRRGIYGSLSLFYLHIEWNFEENVELTDEMVETYCNLVRIGMEGW